MKRLYLEKTPTLVHAMAVLASLGLVTTILVVVRAWLSATNATNKPAEAVPVWIAGAIWAVLPAVWFWYEYFYLYRVHGNPEAFEEYKHGQQLSIAIWAAVTIALYAVASSDHFKAPGP